MMGTEIELKLQLSPKIAKKIATHPLLKALPSETVRLLNTYYDTPSLELHNQRIAVRFRKKQDQWLLTVKSAEPASGGLAMRSEWEAVGKPGEFNFEHVDNTVLQDFLTKSSEQFEAIFTTDFHRKIWRIPYGESVIEMAIDTGSVKSKSESLPICEIELELLSGKIADIFSLTRTLQKEHSLYPAIASKAERGYKLFLNQPTTAFRSKPPLITAEMSPIGAFRVIALSCLEHFQRNEYGLQTEGAPEFVHQARVAIRRLRSAIKLFSPALPKEFVHTYGKAWQSLASALGDARNWDVFLTQTLPPIETFFPKNCDVLRLRNESKRQIKSTRRAIKRILSMKEYPRLLVEFTAAVYALSDTLPSDLLAFACSQIDQQAKAARKLASRHRALNPNERHAMRISFKKLRYSLEFFSPLLPQSQLAPYLTTLLQLQDKLGLINDHVTAESLIAPILAKRPTGPIQGWITGRHEMLISELPPYIDSWLQQTSFWKKLK